MIAVILHPHSNTNPSDKYRVVDSHVWNEKNGVAPVLGEFGNYSDAETKRDELNAD